MNTETMLQKFQDSDLTLDGLISSLNSYDLAMQVLISSA